MYLVKNGCTFKMCFFKTSKVDVPFKLGIWYNFINTKVDEKSLALFCNHKWVKEIVRGVEEEIQKQQNHPLFKKPDRKLATNCKKVSQLSTTQSFNLAD